MYQSLPPLLLLLLIHPINFSRAAHSNKRHTFVRSYTEPKNTQYDRSITLFSDEGRLLQVEYAIEASSTRGNSVICLNYNGSIICSAIVTKEGYDDEDTKDHEENDGDYTDIILQTEDNKMHRIENNCFLITTGLSRDGNALAHASRLTYQRIRRENGDNNEDFDSTMPMRENANYISDMQHELTRTSGARPFGISATIIGVDKTSEELHLYQSEAGGTLEEYDFIACGKNRMLLQQKLH